MEPETVALYQCAVTPSDADSVDFGTHIMLV